jgi:hypothetical protein
MHKDLLIICQVLYGQCVGLGVNGKHGGPDIVEGPKHHLLGGIVAAVVTWGTEGAQLIP